MSQNSPSRSRYPVRFLIASFVALSAAGCAKQAPPHPAQGPVAVSITTVRRANVPYEVEANGIVTPRQTAAVVPQVDGIVKEVDFEEGQQVTQGQVLFRIDPRPYQAAFDQATAALKRDQATATYSREQSARYDTLALSRAVTREEADQMLASSAASAATVEADKAALENAKFNLDNTVIRAPISGRTGSLLVHVGNVVHASGNTPLVVINQIQPTLVRFAVPGSILPLILRYGAHGGLPVTVVPSDQPSAARDSTMSLDAPPPVVAAAPHRADTATVLNPDSRGELSFIDNTVDTSTGTLLLKATFPNRDGTLWAGQFVAATLRLYVEDSALVIPTAAIVTGQAGAYVWVVDSSNTADEHPVVVERSSGDLSVITSGIDAGDKVVISGQSRLTPGAAVTVSPPNGLPPGPDSAQGGRAGRHGGRGGRRGG